MTIFPDKSEAIIDDYSRLYDEAFLPKCSLCNGKTIYSYE